MAEVKIDAVITTLDTKFMKALDQTMQQFASSVVYNRDDLYRFFLERITNHCRAWEPVPDSSVKR